MFDLFSYNVSAHPISHHIYAKQRIGGFKRQTTQSQTSSSQIGATSPHKFSRHLRIPIPYLSPYCPHENNNHPAYTTIRPIVRSPYHLLPPIRPFSSRINKHASPNETMPKSPRHIVSPRQCGANCGWFFFGFGWVGPSELVQMVIVVFATSTFFACGSPHCANPTDNENRKVDCWHRNGV